MRPLSVVIPSYNEARTLAEVVRCVGASPVVAEVIVVDDGSTDGTADLLQRLPATVLRQPRNLGKGAAVRRGFAAASAEILVVQDADLEYDPADFPALIRPIEEGRADVVFGTRFLGARGLSLHTLGNRALTLWSNLFTGLHVSDAHCCYKAIRRSVLPRLRLSRDRFDIDPEIVTRVAALGLRLAEVPVRYRRRTEGKKIGWRDAVEALLLPLRC